MEIVGVHHIELNVNDLERSFKFYTRLFSRLGATIEHSNQAFTVTVAGFYLYVKEVEDRFREVSYHRKRTGLDHLAFRLGGKEDVLQLENWLHSESIPLLHRADYYGPKYFALYLEDPDRIKLEFGVDAPRQVGLQDE